MRFVLSTKLKRHFIETLYKPFFAHFKTYICKHKCVSKNFLVVCELVHTPLYRVMGGGPNLGEHERRKVVRGDSLMV